MTIIDPSKPIPYQNGPLVIHDSDPTGTDGAFHLQNVFRACQNAEVAIDLQTNRPVFIDGFAVKGVAPGGGEHGLIQAPWSGAQLHLTNGLFVSELIGLPGSFKARALNVPYGLAALTVDQVLMQGTAGIRVRADPASTQAAQVVLSRIRGDNQDGAGDDGTGGRLRGNVWGEGDPNRSQGQSQFLVLENLRGGSFTDLWCVNTPGLTTAEDLLTPRNCSNLTFTNVLLDGHYRGRVEDSDSSYFNRRAPFGPDVGGGVDAHGIYRDGRGAVDSGCQAIFGDGDYDSSRGVSNIKLTNYWALECYVGLALEGRVQGLQMIGGGILRSGFTPDGRLRVPQYGAPIQVSDFLRQTPGAGRNNLLSGVTLGYDYYLPWDGSKNTRCPLDQYTMDGLKAAGFSVTSLRYVAPTLARIQQARDAMTKTWATSGKVPGLLTA